MRKQHMGRQMLVWGIGTLSVTPSSPSRLLLLQAQWSNELNWTDSRERLPNEWPCGGGTCCMRIDPFLPSFLVRCGCFLCCMSGGYGNTSPAGLPGRKQAFIHVHSTMMCTWWCWGAWVAGTCVDESIPFSYLNIHTSATWIQASVNLVYIKGCWFLLDLFFVILHRSSQYLGLVRNFRILHNTPTRSCISRSPGWRGNVHMMMFSGVGGTCVDGIIPFHLASANLA